jgi:hypothetical protein
VRGSAVFPGTVQEALARRGEPLSASLRDLFEPRFNHDFGDVRIHADTLAAESAKAMQASAFAVGPDIVFGAGYYQPVTPQGRWLLAHELTHVVQHASTSGLSKAVSSPGDASEQDAERVASIVASGSMANVGPASSAAFLQRQSDLTLTMPQLGAPRREYRLFPPGQEPHLHLDPWVQAYSLLDPDMIQRALINLDLGGIAASPAGPLQSPAAPSTAATPTPTATVPQTPGPTAPRPASAGDVLSALVAVPEVKAAINRLRDTATDRLQHDWRRLSTSDKVVAIGGTALVAGGALAEILSNNASRQFALQQIQGRAIPVPLVPGLSVQVNPIGPNQSVMLNLDLSALARKLGI